MPCSTGPLRALVMSAVVGVALTGCGGGGGGGGAAGKPTDPGSHDPASDGAVLHLAVNAVLPAQDVVARAGETVTFAVELGNEADVASVRWEWLLDGIPQESDGPGIELATAGLEFGTHVVTVRLSRGKATSMLSWKLQVPAQPPQNRPPVILQAFPPDDEVVAAGDTVDFAVAASDVDAGDALDYTWQVDGMPLPPGQGRRLSLEATALEAGEHTVTVAVSDGRGHPGEQAVEKTWSVRVGEAGEIARPRLSGAWPLGDLRLPPRSRVRFEVEAAGLAEADAEARGFRWEINGRRQGTTTSIFELDTRSGEEALAPGVYRVTCALDGAGEATSGRGNSHVGWTIQLDADPAPLLSPAGAQPDNSPPVVTSIFPPAPVRLLAGESESFRIDAMDPDGDILSYQWLVNGTLQLIAGPALTHTVPPTQTEGPLRVEVFVTDGHFAASSDEMSTGLRLGAWDVALEPVLDRALTATTGAVIVDNRDAGASATSGVWIASSAAGAHGADSVYSKTPGATYTFSVQVPTAGTYDVLCWWTSWPSRSGAVPIAITHRSGTASTRVDQRVNGGRWNNLGRFEFTSSARVVITSVGSETSTSADAVSLSPVVQPPPAPSPGTPPTQPTGVEFVIDDGTAGTSSQGTWTTSSAPAAYGGRSLFAKGSGSYTFLRPLAGPGTYDVYAWWTEWSSRDPAAPYAVVHSQGTTTIKVDQRQGGGKWNLLGRFSFGSRVEVRLTVPGAASVSADAVRFLPTSGGTLPPPPPPPVAGEVVIDNGAAGTSAVGTWTASTAPNPYGATSLYAKGTGSYSYRATLPAPGTYSVHAWYTQWPSRESAVPYEVTHAAGTKVIRVDQRANGGQWRYLGDFAFNALASVTVRVVDADTVSADAMRFAFRSASTDPTLTGPTLSWTAPTKNADGSQLLDLAGYRVYSGSGANSLRLLEDVRLRTEYQVTSLSPGTYTIAIKAYDASGNESSFSNTLTTVVP